MCHIRDFGFLNLTLDWRLRGVRLVYVGFLRVRIHFGISISYASIFVDKDARLNFF